MFTAQMRMENLHKISSIIDQRGLHYPLDISLIGATGVGKSSTINALFGRTLAKVGTGVEPETKEISVYQAGRFRLYDTAGLGDGLVEDRRHSINLTNLLLKTYTTSSQSNIRYHLIDLCLVILDGASRDMGTIYKTLENIVLKCISPSRVIVAINQADLAMKGRYWDNMNNCPQKELIHFLEEKSYSVKERIKEATGLMINLPICYSAEKQWNLDKLMEHIIKHIPYYHRRVNN